jgi:uncharacterized protein (TIGR03792 family)
MTLQRRLMGTVLRGVLGGVLRGVLPVLLVGVIGLQAGQGASAAAEPAAVMRPGVAAASPSSPASRAPMADTCAEQPPEHRSGDGQSSDGQSEVVEVLRLRVPAAAREAWLTAERASWEPWLAGQDGFLGRQLFWDPQRQEGLLLIRWASRAQWKAIPADTVQAVQERFERHACRLTGSAANPFPLVFEAELQPL